MNLFIKVRNLQKLFKQQFPHISMEKQEFVTKKELDEFNEKLDGFMRQIQGIKSTIEILQDEEAMNEIIESEELERKGVKSTKINF